MGTQLGIVKRTDVVRGRSGGGDMVSNGAGGGNVAGNGGGDKDVVSD